MKKHIRKQGISIKGLSPVVSTIILIMIVIIIAILIILWFKVFFKEAVLKEVGGNSKRAEDFCNEVQLLGTTDPDGSVVVSNQGNIPVNALVFKTSSVDGGSDTTTKGISINPGYSQTIPPNEISSYTYTQLKIIPVLLGKKKGDLVQRVTCPEKYAIKIK